MFISSADLSNTYAIESGDFERRAGLGTFIGIEPALASMVITTANDITLTCQKQGVRSAAAYLDDLLLKYVKCL